MVINLLFLNINTAGMWLFSSLNHGFLILNVIEIVWGSEAGIENYVNFHAVSSTACLCPGDVLQYECTLKGNLGGSTVWRGSAFMTCGYIALLHSQFAQGTRGTCNSGDLIGSSLRYGNGSYTSQLSITLSRELDETSIQCIHDNGSQLLTIGVSKVELKGSYIFPLQKYKHKSTILPIILDPVPPPDRITLSLDRPGWLFFSWNENVTGCETIQYRTIASN